MNPLKRVQINDDLDPTKMINPGKVNSLLKMQEMLFIYNAVLDGWVVQKLPDDRFQFSKDRKQVTSDVVLDSYLKEFVNYYLTLNTQN